MKLSNIFGISVRELTNGTRIRLVVGLASISLVLAMFDLKSSLLKQPQSITIDMEHTNKKIRDALATAVIGMAVNESYFLDRARPLDLPRLHEMLSCDSISVDSLIQYLNGTSSDCSNIMMNIFDRSGISSTDDALRGLEQFYGMTKTPGGGCQLRDGFTCDYYGAKKDEQRTVDPNIGILVIAAGVNDLARQLSIENKVTYASMHGYDLHVLEKEPGGFQRDRPWLKIPYMASLLHKYDYIWSLDLDTLILDMSFDLKRLIDSRFDLVVGLDSNGINTGSFFLKNSDWSSLLLYTWWLEDDVEPLGWWEQAAIHKMSKNDLIGNHIKRIKQEEFNSYEGNIMLNPEKLPFVLHFPGDAEKWSKVVKYTELLKNVTSM